MKIAIMQPTYFPWTGFFNLMAACDAFVFLDDVQFARRSWQQRQRIVLGGKEHMLTIPVISKGRRTQLLKDVVIDSSQPWADRHLETIRHAYGGHPFGDWALDVAQGALTSPGRRLVEVTIPAIRAIAAQLNLEVPFYRSSELGVTGSKSIRLLQICHQLEADVYLSAAGSQEYIESEGVFDRADVRVEYQVFTPPPYQQVGVDRFIPFMSMLDVMANIGPTATVDCVSIWESDPYMAVEVPT